VDVAVWLSAPACAHCWATGEVSAEGKCAQPVNTKAKTKTAKTGKFTNLHKAEDAMGRESDTAQLF